MSLPPWILEKGVVLPQSNSPNRPGDMFERGKNNNGFVFPAPKCLEHPGHLFCAHCVPKFPFNLPYVAPTNVQHMLTELWPMLSHSSAKACWKPDLFYTQMPPYIQHYNTLSYMGAIKVLPSIFVRMRSKMKMWWSCFMGQNEPTRNKFIFSCLTPHIPENSFPHQGSCGNCWKSTKSRNESFLLVDFVYYVYYENSISKWHTTYNAIGAKLANIVTLTTRISSAIYGLRMRRIVWSHEPTKTNFIVSCNPKNSHCGWWEMGTDIEIVKIWIGLSTLLKMVSVELMQFDKYPLF